MCETLSYQIKNIFSCQSTSLLLLLQVFKNNYKKENISVDFLDLLKNKSLTQFSMVSSKDILVKGLSTSKLAMK